MTDKKRYTLSKRARGHTTESVIQQNIINTLSRMGVLVNRVNNGSFIMQGKRKSRRIKCNSLRGKSDLEAWITIRSKTTKKEFAICVYIEVKTAKGKMLPSQKEFKETLERHNGKYILARSVSSCINQLIDYKDELEESFSNSEVIFGKIKNLARMKEEN